MAPLARLGLVVHPSRDLEPALVGLRRWAQEHGVELVQLRAHEHEPELAPAGAAQDVDLVVAIGGDGTVLGALRMGARADKAVLGVACGSLGALAAVPPGGIEAALDRVAAGNCELRPLPILEVHPEEGEPVRALNDLVVLRAGAGQVGVSVWLDGALYARWTGDGAAGCVWLRDAVCFCPEGAEDASPGQRPGTSAGPEFNPTPRPIGSPRLACQRLFRLDS